MDKIITDERTGLTYELIGDYYFVAVKGSTATGCWSICGNGTSELRSGTENTRKGAAT